MNKKSLGSAKNILLKFRSAKPYQNILPNNGMVAAIYRRAPKESDDINNLQSDAAFTMAEIRSFEISHDPSYSSREQGEEASGEGEIYGTNSLRCLHTWERIGRSFKEVSTDYFWRWDPDIDETKSVVLLHEVRPQCYRRMRLLRRSRIWNRYPNKGEQTPVFIFLCIRMGLGI